MCAKIHQKNSKKFGGTRVFHAYIFLTTVSKAVVINGRLFPGLVVHQCGFAPHGSAVMCISWGRCLEGLNVFIYFISYSKLISIC